MTRVIRVTRVTKGDNGVKGERIALCVVAVEGLEARGVGTLPHTVGVVDEQVVHPEGRVAGAGIDIGHDTSNTVMAIGVRSALVC